MPEKAYYKSCEYTWSCERQLVPVYEELSKLASQTQCLEEIEELIKLQTHQMNDLNELFAVLELDIPGTYTSMPIQSDLTWVLSTLDDLENQALESGYLIMDPVIESQVARGILDRITRRQARQIALIKKIIEKCAIVLPERPHRPRPPRPEPPGPPEMSPGRLEYVVQPGDTMFLIAKRYGIPLDVLIRANPQIRNPELIYPGEVIYIPRRYPHGPRPELTMEQGTRRYVVSAGDTLLSISEKFGMTVSELMAFNPHVTENQILTAGDVILIPGSGAVG